MNLNRFSFVLSAVSIFALPAAQGLELYNNNKSTLDIEGNLSIYYLRNKDFEEVNDGFSRFYFDFSHKMKNEWQAFAKLEWGVQLSNTDDKIIVNHNGLTSTGPATDSLWVRQGFVGFKHDNYGQLSLGKQWGVSYDVGGVTDWFEIFGAEASGTYNFGTDGGFSGSGRAEQAIQYRYYYQNFSFAGQYLASEDELHTSGENGEELSAILNFNNSFGVSVIYQTPFDIGLGIAYNKAKIKLSANGQSTSKVDDELITAHVTYRPYGSDGLHVAFVYTDMKNHDINDVGKIMSKSRGIELFSAYRFDNDISLILGYNSLKDNSTGEIGSDGTFHKQYYILSAKYHWDEDFYLYIESKIDNSTLAENTTSLAEDATGIGMMFTF
ncbi:porin [Litorilituus lipolyticus]|uniref:Porin n=1 Tax=Litorilituus lipolyticus TaxID=2491017 RepID=A0A502KS74_9GAMM|nr:porin [Litorilituus lipolyticus]TPH14432.1 porin [Litorilituus lipolyticus]